MKFSERIGKTEIRTVIQHDSMDDVLKNRLFNVVKEIIDARFMDVPPYINQSDLHSFCDFFGEKITNYSGLHGDFLRKLEFRIYANDDIWFLYNLIDWLSKTGLSERYQNKFNQILEQEKSAYRLDDSGELIRVSDEVEVAEINLALERTQKYATVSEHLRKAREAYSQREKPDYANSVKESVFAVEALAKIIANDENATLESALRKVPDINPNLKSYLDKLYHYRGDQGGIGHSLKEGQVSEVSEPEARLIMINAHAVVNYLISTFIEKNGD